MADPEKEVACRSPLGVRGVPMCPVGSIGPQQDHSVDLTEVSATRSSSTRWAPPWTRARGLATPVGLAERR